MSRELLTDRKKSTENIRGTYNLLIKNIFIKYSIWFLRTKPCDILLCSVFIIQNAVQIVGLFLLNLYSSISFFMTCCKVAKVLHV